MHAWLLRVPAHVTVLVRNREQGVLVETNTPLARSSARQFARRVQLAAIALALLASGVGIGAFASARAQSDATPVGAGAEETMDACPDDLYGPDSEPWVRGELYFGTTTDEGTAYSEEEWNAFLDAEITPRFPAGLTVLTGLGQWQQESGEVLQERSEVLVILYPLETARESSVLLEEIRDVYETQFNQESVLRVDVAPACTSF
jgi:hypothetical protein